MLPSATKCFTVRPKLCRGHIGNQVANRRYSFLGGVFDKPEIANSKDILKALENKKAVLVDNRSPDEIRSSGKVQYKSLAWVNAPGSPFDCPSLANGGAEKVLPGDKGTPIIVYCASGKRAQKAKNILEEEGYTQVLNAGGMEDFVKLLN